MFYFFCVIGFDTRIGFGFSLGDLADAQIVVEIGPQQRTRNLKPTKTSFNSKYRALLFKNKYKYKKSVGKLLKKLQT